MCGRYTLVSPIDRLQQRFKFPYGDLDLSPRYNIAPTQEVLVVANDGERHAEMMRWGLIPFWVKDQKISYSMINAMGETVAEKPAFRTPLRKRRCLVIADGFYEWQKQGAGKVPVRIVLKSREPFAFAGLWDSWTDKTTGSIIRSCTIITTTPNAVLEPIHNRMPVILPEEAEYLWLDPRTEDPTILTNVLCPYPEEEMEAYEVSSTVNNVKNHGPDLIEAVGTRKSPQRPPVH